MSSVLRPTFLCARDVCAHVPLTETAPKDIETHSNRLAPSQSYSIVFDCSPVLSMFMMVVPHKHAYTDKLAIRSC